MKKKIESSNLKKNKASNILKNSKNYQNNAEYKNNSQKNNAKLNEGEKELAKIIAGEILKSSNVYFKIF